MANNQFRVVIPTNADAFITLCDEIIEKEEELAPNGILSAAELQELKDLRTDAAKANKEAKQLEKQAEDKTKARDLCLGKANGQGVATPGTALFFVTKLRDKALADNKTNPKAIGEWGFVVDDSPKKKKPKP
jgi:hypothetical protein